MERSPEKKEENLPVDGFVVEPKVSKKRSVRAYDVGVSKKVADILELKQFDYQDDNVPDKKDLWPLHGVTGGEENDCYVVTSSRIGPKAFVKSSARKAADCVSKDRLKTLNRIADFVVELVTKDHPGLMACDRDALSEVKKEVFGECFCSLCVISQEKLNEFGFTFERMCSMDVIPPQQQEEILKRQRFMVSLARVCDAKLRSLDGLNGFMRKYNLVFCYSFEVKDIPSFDISIADADDLEDSNMVTIKSCGEPFFKESL